jgi:hypothetical protein
MGFIEWFEAGGLIAVAVAVYSALELTGNIVGMMDGPDPNDRPSKAIAMVNKLKGFLRMVGIGARYKDEGPVNPLPLSGDTGRRVKDTEAP